MSIAGEFAQTPRSGETRSRPCAVAISRRAPIASTSARQNASSAKASPMTPTLACWRTLATAAGGQRAQALLVAVFPARAPAAGSTRGRRADRRVRAPAAASCRPPSSHTRVVDDARALDRRCPCAAYQRCISMWRGSISVSNCARVFSAMPMRHGTTLVAEEAVPAVEQHEHRAVLGRQHALRASAARRRRWRAGTSRSRAPAASAGTAARRSAGTRVRPSSSTGTRALKRERSSSTACAARDRLATHRIASSSYSRRYARTLRLPGSQER